LNVRNCLFVRDAPNNFAYEGIRLVSFYDTNPEWIVTNCTFHGFDRGETWEDAAILALLWGTQPGHKPIHLDRNIFSYCYRGVYSYLQSTNPSSTLNYNGVWQCDDFAQGDLSGSPWVALSNPFESNANGSYYLKDLPVGETDFLDKGLDTTAEAAGLSGKATRAATVANGRIKQSDITQSQTWTRFEGALDTGLVDLGYHYEPVDIIARPSFVPYQFADLRVTGWVTTLWINPGVVVAFAADITDGGLNVSSSARIVVSSGASLDAQGTGPQPIVFTSTAASGDGTYYAKGIGHPCNDPSGVPDWYHTAIELATGFGAKTRIRYCNFSHMMLGIGMGATPYPITLVINNCRFRFGNAGIGVNLMQTGVTWVSIQNCLFHHLAAEGIVADSPSIYSFIFVIGCSFDRITWGVLLADIAPAVVIDSIFQNFSWAIDAVNWEPWTWEFYNCFSTEPTNFTPYETDIVADPSFDPCNPPVADIDERYYLQGYSLCVDDGALLGPGLYARGYGLSLPRSGTPQDRAQLLLRVGKRRIVLPDHGDEHAQPSGIRHRAVLFRDDSCLPRRAREAWHEHDACLPVCPQLVSARWRRARLY
jgi:hypothetical protein